MVAAAATIVIVAASISYIKVYYMTITLLPASTKEVMFFVRLSVCLSECHCLYVFYN